MMELWRKEAFAVIGLEGSSEDGPGFISRLWQEANAGFAQVEILAKHTEQGLLAGVWGAMTDLSRRFMPWENGFSRGLYLAGVECREDAVPPAGWTRWEIPGFVYLRVKGGAPDAFAAGLSLLEEQGHSLVGAVQEFTDPTTGIMYLCFPVECLGEK